MELRHAFSETRLLFCSDVGLERGFDCGVGGVREGSGDAVRVPADATLSFNGFCSSKVAIIWVLTTPHIKCRSTFATQMQCCGHGLDVLPASGF